MNMLTETETTRLLRAIEKCHLRIAKYLLSYNSIHRSSMKFTYWSHLKESYNEVICAGNDQTQPPVYYYRKIEHYFPTKLFEF